MSPTVVGMSFVRDIRRFLQGRATLFFLNLFVCLSTVRSLIYREKERERERERDRENTPLGDSPATCFLFDEIIY